MTLCYGNVMITLSYRCTCHSLAFDWNFCVKNFVLIIENIFTFQVIKNVP